MEKRKKSQNQSIDARSAITEGSKVNSNYKNMKVRITKLNYTDIKYNVVGLCNLDGYLVDVWEIKNNENITERGWAMFNDEDNACLVSSKKYSFKKSDVSTDFFGDKI